MVILAEGSRREWAVAYHAQAKTDLEAARQLDGEPASVVCMLLQMGFEKLAKAALLLNHDLEIEKAARSHFAAGRLVRLLHLERSRLSALAPWLHGHTWSVVRNRVRQLEVSNPAVAAIRAEARGVNAEDILEYPWYRSGTESVCWPEAHLGVARELTDPRSLHGRWLQRFAHDLADRLFDVF